MSSSLVTIEAQALKLPAQERVRLADRLLASVSGDPDLEQAWAAEVDRRLEEVEAGASLIDLDAAVARARRAIP